MKADEVVSRHVFDLDPNSCGGESLLLETKFIANGDPGEVFMNQILTLQSYGNSASFNLCGTVLTPESLRKLANELESAQIHAEELVKN